jgi:hypothetical protein
MTTADRFPHPSRFISFFEKTGGRGLKKAARGLYC